jgi:hypothetical protein
MVVTHFRSKEQVQGSAKSQARSVRLEGIDPTVRFSTTKADAARKALGQMVGIAFHEIDGFLLGMIALDRAHVFSMRSLSALSTLEEIRAILFSSMQVLGDPSKAANPADIVALMHNIDRLNTIAQQEIDLLNSACKEAGTDA